MRDNPALQHVPMAVGGEGMLVTDRLSTLEQLLDSVSLLVDIELFSSSVRGESSDAGLHCSTTVSQSGDCPL